jgi:hypothetical protein
MPIVSTPSKVIEPRRLAMMPMIDFSVVVLPAPLRPSRVTTSPGRDIEVDAVQHVGFAVPGFEAAHREQRRRRARRGFWSRAPPHAWPDPI